MKKKSLVIIFILFLLIALSSAYLVFFTREKKSSTLYEQSVKIVKSDEPVASEPAEIVADEPELKATSTMEQAAPKPVEEKDKAIMLINGAEYEIEINAGGSAYDLMKILQTENKISFSGKNYADLGFFIEEINGVKNNPLAENWVYYINGRPAKVGISFYQLKINDIIEWKYEKKSF